VTAVRRWGAAAGLAVVVGVVVLIVVVVTGGSSSPTTGYDISYPQCSGSYPSNPLFGIVGVNGGLANKPNPCLRDELAWARGAPGQEHPKQPRLSLYIDTAYPGSQAADWPRGGISPFYGACNGSLTNACSYVYGEQRAEHDYRLVAVIDRHSAETAPWWLDVELSSSWARLYELNWQALEGFLAGLRNEGVGSVGIYSTRAQWHDITGFTSLTTPEEFGTGWVAGTRATLAQARRNCTNRGFTGYTPTLAQYRIGPRDADLRCPR
jgi:hypothetical protein